MVLTKKKEVRDGFNLSQYSWCKLLYIYICIFFVTGELPETFNNKDPGYCQYTGGILWMIQRHERHRGEAWEHLVHIWKDSMNWNINIG